MKSSINRMAEAITLARKTRKNMEVPAHKERQKTKKAIAEGIGREVGTLSIHVQQC